MTRKSKRELERALENLTDNRGRDTPEDRPPSIVYDTGDELLDGDGEPAPTDEDGEPVAPPDGPLVILDAEYAKDAPAGGNA